MENNEMTSTRTILSSMEEIISLAKKHSLEPEFYKEAEESLKYISERLSLSREESMQPYPYKLDIGHDQRIQYPYHLHDEYS